MSEVEKYYEVEQAVATIQEEGVAMETDAPTEPPKLFNDDAVIIKGLLSKVLGKATAFYSRYIVSADQLDINQLITALNEMMKEELYDLLFRCYPAYIVHEGELKLINRHAGQLMGNLGKEPTQAQVLDSYLELMTGIAKSYKLV
jgi:hypothetical protein